MSDLIDHFERLPGIGPKTAQRLVFHLLHFPSDEISKFSDALESFKRDTVLCSICKNVGDSSKCNVCSATDRERDKLAVVASPLDLFALERSGYKGIYHVLHGLIDPLNNIGPEEIFTNSLLDRLQTGDLSKSSNLEVIMATNTSMLGESTAMYLVKLIKDSDIDLGRIKITRIARGLPVGGDIEYADEITLSRALEGRGEF